jgi:hypothetical protein
MECVNKFIPLRTKKEYYEDNKEVLYFKQKERLGNYSDDRKKEMKEYQRDYRASHKAKVKEYNKVYHTLAENKEWRAEKVVCECGVACCRGSLTDHKKSKKHQSYLQSILSHGTS